MRQALGVIAAIASEGQVDALALPWSALRQHQTAAIRATLIERYAPATVNKMLSALRGVLKTAWRLGQMEAESCALASKLATVEDSDRPAGRSLTPEEIRALLVACRADGTTIGVRDAALIGVLYCGLRRAEVAGLNLGDCQVESGTLWVADGVRPGRVVPLALGVSPALANWLVIRGDEPGPLFLPVLKDGKARHRRLSDQAVYNAIRRRAAQAGIAGISPRDFRHTLLQDLLDAGVGVVTVQNILGYTNPQAVSRYGRPSAAAERLAMSALQIPPVRPPRLAPTPEDDWRSW